MKENAMRTLQEKLTYDSGLTVCASHAISIKTKDREITALAYIPRKGLPRLTTIQGKFIKTFKIKGNTMTTEGERIINDYLLEEFKAQSNNIKAIINLED
jgi:hypothetical protein